MPEIAVRVEGLGKRYRRGAREPYGALRDRLAAAPRALWRGLSGRRPEAPHHWALRDVSFELRSGEVLGVIGRNGAGKSTLLKILSRITAPTTGRATVWGRVGSLLEVGTGFHPELTGRENIYVNGAILGMSQAEIRRRFDEIVDFAGVEKYLDTPVKHYSSGMRVRLAFAVAAHLEPEVLIVDEVLAVGDAAFQKKCLGRMGKVAGEGRTVLFVSHQMEAIQRLCGRAIWLDEGEVRLEGDGESIVRRYMAETLNTASEGLLDRRADRQGSGPLRVRQIAAQSRSGGPIASGDDVEFIFDCEIDGVYTATPSFNMAIRDDMDRMLLFLSDLMTGDELTIEGGAKVVCRVPKLPLAPGRYAVDYAVRVGGQVNDKLLRALSFDVQPGDYYGTGRAVHPNTPFLCRQKWSVGCESRLEQDSPPVLENLER